jgi:hypothetical protein
VNVVNLAERRRDRAPTERVAEGWCPRGHGQLHEHQLVRERRSTWCVDCDGWWELYVRLDKIQILTFSASVMTVRYGMITCSQFVLGIEANWVEDVLSTTTQLVKTRLQRVLTDAELGEHAAAATEAAPPLAQPAGDGNRAV